MSHSCCFLWNSKRHHLSSIYNICLFLRWKGEFSRLVYFFPPQLCHVTYHFYLLHVVVRARDFYDLCGNFWCSSCCRKYHEVLSSVLSRFAPHCTRINVRCKSHFDKAFMFCTCWLPCCEVCLLALKNCTDLPLIGLWCDFNCLWSTKGFTEWFESVTSHKTRRGYSPSSVEDPHSICSSSFFFGLISCFLFTFSGVFLHLWS